MGSQLSFNSFLKCCASALAIILLLSLSTQPKAYSQVLYGSIVGTVTDPQGAVVAAATVTITNTGTGVSRGDKADSQGRFSFLNVTPGTYVLKVESAGFKTFEASGLAIQPNTIGRVDAKLELGQVADTVTVSGEAAALQTEKADTHGTVTSKELQNMPVGGYRNYETLINLVPGATPAAAQNSITDTPGRALAIHVNGGNSQTNITRIDGAASVNVWLPHHVGYVTPIENVDVVNITTTAADAEQGMAGSSAITLISKSGTNDIHGSAYEFHNDQHLNSRAFFQGYGTDKPVAIYNNFGGTVGGPIKKNKLFYFLSFDRTAQKTASPGFYTVPTAAFERGDFSGVSTVLYDPFSAGAGGQSGNGTGRTPFAGNIIPAQDISPIAQKLQSYYPAPNVGGPTAYTNNYTATGGPVLDRKYFDAKANWNIDDKDTAFVKYGRMWATAGGQAVFGVAGGSGLGGSDPGTGDTTIQVATIGFNRTISPTMLFDAVVGYERQDQILTPNDYGTNYGLELGIPNTNGPNPLQSGFPNIAISGYSGFGVGSWMPATRVEESYTNSDNLTWTKGAHELRFGFDLVRHHLNHWQPEIGQGPRGYLGFSGGETALAGGASTNQYNAYAAFLLGLSNDTEKSLQYILSTGREWQFGWYVRDRWQVNKNLTINVGLRYELYPLMTRAGYGIERYDPSTNLVYMGGRGDVPEDAGISVSHTLFAPRVGIAYRLDEKSVLRTGYGINYDPIPFSRPLRGWYPLVVNQANVATNGYNWSTTLAEGVPNTQGPDVSSGVTTLPGNVSERSPYSFIHRGYTQSYNLTYERKLPGDLITSVAYVGSHSVHLLADQDINSGYPGSGTAGLPYNIPGIDRTVSTQMWDGYLSSNYNSLQVAVNRSFSKGLMVKAAYTWSKAMDYTDDDGWASVGWNWSPVFQRNYAPAGFDRTQILQIGWVYDLPAGKGKKFANSGLAAKVLGGWEVNGVMAAYTGTPFTVTAPGTSLNAPDNTQTANQVLADVPVLGGVGTTGPYYNPAAFTTVTAAATFGTSGRNLLRAPGVFNTDLDITRQFAIKERLNLQFRAEFFNLANSPQFGAPNADSSSAAFMTVTSASGERNIRFALRAQW